MKLSIEVGEEMDRTAWNERVCSVLAGSYRQTSHYGDFKKQWREKALYFLARDERGAVVGQLLAVCGSPWGWTLERYPLSPFTQRLAQWIAPRLYWAEGPLVFTAENREEVAAQLLRAAVDEASRRGCVEVGGNPSFYGEEPEEARQMYARIFSGLGGQVSGKATFLVDLRRGEELLWKAVRREARTKVRKAGRDGIEIQSVDGSEESLCRAYGPMRDTARRNGVPILDYADFCRSFRHHHSLGIEEAFISLLKGEILSFQQVVYVNRNALLGGVSHSDLSREKQLYGNDLMQWHMITWARKKGMRWLDFGGADPESDDPKIQGIYAFKAKWGGKLVRYNTFTARLPIPRFGRVLALSDALHRRVRGGVA